MHRSTVPLAAAVMAVLSGLVLLLLPSGEVSATPGDVTAAAATDVTAAADVAAAVAAGEAAAVAAGEELLAGVAEETCAGLLPLQVADVLLCTHGEDELVRADGPDNRPGSPVPARGTACVGDGTSGQRVEVLHVRRAGTDPAPAALRADLGRWLGQVEWTVGRSAERLGGQRQVRWLTDADCDVAVRSVTVGAAAMDDFATMIERLRDRGYDAGDRTYLLFVDDDSYCGIATAPRDDAAQDNRATRRAGYARVDRPCWDSGDEGYHSVAAHELVHTLGAVQDSAPNASGLAHCSDEHDLLCYDDGTSPVRVVCRDHDDATRGAGDANDRLLDCNGDDYFHPSPAPGSYLASHWNVADHPRLHDPADVPAPPQDPEADAGFGIDVTALLDDLQP